MIELDLDVQDFASDWSNCDSMSSYVSRMVCHNRTDSLLFANLYSSALNELLETAFRVHGRTGQLVCRFRRTGDVDRIEIDMPSDDGVLSFYQGAVDLARGPDAQTVYLDKLFSSDVPDMALSLLELSVDYGADLSLTRDDQAQRLCLAAELVLEEPKP
ncbi:ubiquinone biosynthesis methyltransferase UbiE [Roseibium denhamense]|nr:ubiquinone biosynthesis methyltransferase UbiE [Roseibium denhamense]MTI04875.1 ubiquinone biosynthesis methyltransferase UbiE [Roseibium denhamense]